MPKETTIVSENVLLLDQALLKTPQEQLKRNLRTTQRYLERDFNALNASLADLSKSPAAADGSAAATKSVEAMLTRMKALRKKLTELNASTSSRLSGVEARLNHITTLQDMDTQPTSSSSYAAWSSFRLSRQIVDYLLRRGFLDAAEHLAKAEGVEGLVDTELFRECVRIEKALTERKVGDALTWCKENQSALKKAKSTLEFDLRYQEFIELIRTNQTNEAIAHSRKHLVPWRATHLTQIKQAMALMAFGAETSCPPYQKLFSPSRWADLAIKFRYTLLLTHSLSPLPMLSLSLHTGLAALKTQTCFSDEPLSHNLNCPTCSELVKPLAKSKGVPWSHHANSTIVCKITGEVMEGEDEGRTPWVLPNGRVYSKEGLELLALRNEGIIRCPRTGDEYQFAEASKVYIS